MPLLVPAVVESPSPPVTPPATPPAVPPIAPSVTVTTLTDPTGSVWYLSGGSQGIWIQPGRRGFHAPVYQFYEDASPAVDGALLRGVRAITRELFLPLFMQRDSREELTALRRAFVAGTSPHLGACQLTVAQPDGSRRHIDAWRGEGMEGEEGSGDWGVTLMRYGLVLRALEPYFYGDDVLHVWQGVAAQTFFPLVHSPTNFVSLLPSQVLGSTTANNAGDVNAYPVWDVSGPATGITLTNVTTGKTLTLSSSLAGSSNRRIIDTRPEIATVVDETGANRWSELASGSALWPLLPGANTLTVSVTGSTAATAARLTYQPRFEAV